jgi:putative two-component system response regulator
MNIDPLMNPGKIREAKILVVDDHEDGVILLQQLLQKAGYANVFATTDSRETVGVCEEIAADLLILDLNMPPPSGYDILDQLALRPGKENRLPILVLTADITPMAKLKALSLGARDFLTKPVEQVDLLLRVRNLLEIRFALRQIEQERKARSAEESRSRSGLGGNEILERLAVVIECWDPHLAQRAARVGRSAALLAKALELPAAEASQIEEAARLFDIGMLAVPEEIRAKGTLSPEERAQLRTHVAAAERILGKTPGGHAGLKLACNMAVSHHEYWDGGGYPQGLRGEAIPLEARIVAVAEALDSLVHPGSGKAPLSVRDAASEVTRQAGFAFDPAITSALERTLPASFAETHASETELTSQ